MQRYREWERMGGTLRPTLDQRAINRFGKELVYLFEKYDVVRHRIRGADVHTRINFRAAAAARLDDWPKRNLELTRDWRSWECLAKRWKKD